MDYITVTSGLRGYFAVHVRIYKDGTFEPIQTGIGSYTTPEAAAQEGREWAECEGLKFIEHGKRSA